MKINYFYIGFMVIILVVTFFIITFYIDKNNLTVGYTDIPIIQTESLETIYIDSCSPGNYTTFKKLGSDYKTTANSKILNALIPTDINYIEIGYSDNAQACSDTSLTNPKTILKQSFQSMPGLGFNNIDLFGKVPKDKYIYIYFTGSTGSIKLQVLDYQ